MFGLDVLGGLIQKKPKMPGFTQIDAGAEQKKAIGSDIAALPDLEKLISQYTDFTSDQRLQQLNKFIPGYSDVIKKEGEQISNLLAGKLPAGVQDTISRRAAELGVTQGTSGSDFQKFGELRELGLTSLNAITMGFDAASRWIGQAEKPQQFDFSSMFLTPQQQIGLDVSERDSKFQHDWAQELLNMQYDPSHIIGQSLIQTDKDLTQMAISAAGSMGGMAMCWVAREVFGANNPKWLLFRQWLLEDAPVWFRKLYVKYGARVARFIHDKPRLKTLIGDWMESRIYAKFIWKS